VVHADGKPDEPPYMILIKEVGEVHDIFVYYLDGNHGCNDYVLENTPENRDFYEKMMKYSCNEVVTVNPSKEKIYAQDQMIMSYLSNLLKEEASNG
jgi:hypothetical protein